MKPSQIGLYFKWMSAATLQQVVSAFSQLQHPIYFVGGCVRDSLLSQNVNDIDLATPIPPDQVMTTLDEAGINYTQVGRSFGTIVAVVGGYEYQITSFRRDVETDGRWAIVDYTDDLEQDAARRDFTMNALYLTPTGNLFDPQNGIHDLKNGMLRFIGDASQRIREDYLRILRFYRFYAYYGHQDPESELLQACSAHAHQLKNISIERVQVELIKLLCAPHPFAALGYLHTGKILEQFLNATVDLNICQKLAHLEAEIGTILHPLLRLKIIFGSRAHGLVETLKFSRQDQIYLEQLAAFNRYVSQKIHEWLYRVGPELTRAYLCLQALARDTKIDQTSWQQTFHWSLPKFSLSGHDAIALGFTGKSIRLSLATVEQWWIDHHFEPDRTACLRQLQLFRNDH